MKLIAKLFDEESAEPHVTVHRDDCRELGVKPLDRVKIEAASSHVIVVTISDTVVKKGHILIPGPILNKIGAKDKQAIEVTYSPKPDSVRGIRKKMDAQKLTRDEIHEIVFDILENRLSKVEISAWLTALYINGMDTEEIANFTNSMVSTGEKITFDRTPVFDFHSLGGVPGNKITPIVVSIVAAAGLMLPKTSSRAISSACGTSDFVEVFCDVELEASRLKKISEEVGGVLAWGGSMNIAPVDDMVIDIEYLLSINPRAQMLASILSKKLAISATHLLVDIPMGAGTKVKTLEEAREYARDLMELGTKLGMRTECAITYGDQPVGSAIGPALEARECIRILEGNPHPASVVEKACDLAGMILEMGGIPDGPTKAREILSSGAAFKKFREIVEAQGGKKDLVSEDIPLGKYVNDVKAVRSGYVHHINNKDLVTIARAAGAPSDKGAGILLFRKKGQRAEKGETLFQIYADNQIKADRARDVAIKLEPMDIEGMLIKKVPNPSALKSI
ncbi:MAG: AMP phosphorylase [Methanomassiliicoccaceae archaeon]|jgi:AMP phosphorylase|nr:AMP phosphorylase [Methanomassiliicoccaceae archaeon]